MTAVQKIKDLAKAEVGYHEGRSGGHWNNIEKYAPQVPGLTWAQGEAWCATFNSWLDLKAGLKPNVDFPVTASCDAAGDWFKKAKRWSVYPAVGAWVLFGTPSDLSHTGRVVAYDAENIWTVEGNTNTSGSREGDGVYAKVHPRSLARIIGYGYPKFPEGIDSADPKFAAQKPVKVPPAKPPVAKVVVDLSKLQAAARKDPGAGTNMMAAKPEAVIVEKALVAEGLLTEEYSDGHFGTMSIAAYSRWQRKLGYSGGDANGIPGKESLTKLGAKHGFKVSA